MSNQSEQLFNLAKPLVLASSSASRKSLLQRLKLNFSCVSPDIDESPLSDESAAKLAQRLALQKAQKVAGNMQQHYIIGSDQVAECEGHFLGKPMTQAKAIEQLRFQSGKRVHFYTGLCLLDSASGDYQLGLAKNSVQFRPLSSAEITKVVEIDQPIHCAGSFKMESLGLTLFTSVNGDDPTGIIGLPLILLADYLRNISTA